MGRMKAGSQRRHTASRAIRSAHGGIVYREDSRSGVDCSDFQKLQAIASQENIFWPLLCKMHLVKRRFATRDVHPLNLERSGREIAVLFI